MARKTFRLTAARVALIRHFVRFRYLRMSHLYALLGANQDVTGRATRRLVHDFWAHGCLCRAVAPADLRRPTAVVEFAYWLSAKGSALAEQAGLAEENLPSPRSSIGRTLDHELAITEFHIRALETLDSRGLRLHWEQYGLRRGVNPDALLAVTDPAKPETESTAYCFLEVERSALGGYTAGRSVLLRRLGHYSRYQGSTECLSDWRWFREFRVLIVVQSPARRRNLLAQLAAELPLAMFWVAVRGSDLSQAVFGSPADYLERSYSLWD
jgi:hypothetical protein